MLFDDAIVLFDDGVSESDFITHTQPLKDTTFYYMSHSARHKRYYVLANLLKLYQFCNRCDVFVTYIQFS